MATYFAYGAATNDLTSLAAWNSQRDGGGAAPGAFSNSDTYYIERAPAVGGDWLGGIIGAGTGLGTLVITYGGAIASAGAPLIFGIVTKLIVRHNGSGTQYLHPAGTANDDDWTLAQIVSTGREGRVVLNGGSTANCDALTIGAGANVEVGTNFAFTASTGYFRSAAGSNATIAGTSTIPILKAAGQVASNTRPVTSLAVKQTGYVKTSGTSGAVTTLEVEPGGKYYHHAQGTVTTSEVHTGGVASAKGSPYTPTVTNRFLHPNSVNFNDTPLTAAATDTEVGFDDGSSFGGKVAA
jgi:hypothetical protein